MHAAAAGLLLWARAARDIDRQRRLPGVAQQHDALQQTQAVSRCQLT